MPTNEVTEQARLNADNLAHIIAAPAREAYLLLMREAEVRGFGTSVLASSGAKPLRFYRPLRSGQAYFFSCDRTKRYLRCYVRQPALEEWPEIADIVLADQALEAELLSGEVKVIIRTPAEARRLAEILFDRPMAQVGEAVKQVQPTLHLMADPLATSRAFGDWFTALTQEPRSAGETCLLPISGVGLRPLRPLAGHELRVEFWIGDSDAAAVQINEPNATGTERSMAGLAIGEDGSRYIVRQGILRRNNVSERVEAQEFAARTGLSAVDMRIGDRPSSGQWHIVTPLDGINDAAIAYNTAEFVARCWNVRKWNDAAGAEEGRLTELFGAEERGGWFDYVPDPAPRRVLRRQGEVWQALHRLLGSEGIALTKPRHARGYEVDGEVLTKGRSLLIEMKSGVSAADYYCGVGQLMLYAALLPRLKKHEKVLLLPEGRASAALEGTLRPLGIGVHRYRCLDDTVVQVRFSADFLRLCGMTEKSILAHQAF